MLSHEPAQRLAVGAGDGLGPNLPRLPILHADDGSLVRDAAPCARPLALVLVLLFAADVRLVYLDRAGERTALVFPCLPEPVRQMPRALLSDAEIAVELHARHTLQAGSEQVGRERPCLVAKVRAFHDGTRLDAEALAAVAAAVGHGLVLRAGLNAQGATGWAADAVGPALIREERFGGRIIGEHADEVREGDALAMCLARPLLCHGVPFRCGHYSTTGWALLYISPGRLTVRAEGGILSRLYRIHPQETTGRPQWQ